MDPKYKSTELTLGATEEINEILQNSDKVAKEDIDRLVSAIKPPKTKDEVIIENKDDKFIIKKGEEKLKKLSFAQKAEASSDVLDGQIESPNYIVYFATIGDDAVGSLDYPKNVSSALEYSYGQYKSWGFSKPGAKTGIYLIRDNSPFIGYTAQADILGRILLKEVNSNYIKIDVGTLEGNLNKYSLSPKEGIKDISYHENFHLVDPTSTVTKIMSRLKWTETTAQWATLQINPQSKILKLQNSIYFSKPEEGIYSQNPYNIFSFAEFCSLKFGRGFIKRTIDDGAKDIPKYIGEKTDLSKLFHEFAIKSYKLDYQKSVISSGKRPKITKRLDKNVKETGKIFLKQLAINYVQVNPENTTDSTVNFENLSTKGNISVTILDYDSLREKDSFSLKGSEKKKISMKKALVVLSSVVEGTSYSISLGDIAKNPSVVTKNKLECLSGGKSSSLNYEDVASIWDAIPLHPKMSVIMNTSAQTMSVVMDGVSSTELKSFYDGSGMSKISETEFSDNEVWVKTWNQYSGRFIAVYKKEIDGRDVFVKVNTNFVKSDNSNGVWGIYGSYIKISSCNL